MKTYILFVLLIISNHILFSQDLFELVKNNQYRSVKKYKGEVNLRDDFKATPLMWAVYTGNLKMVKRLISKGADVEQKGWIKFVDTLLMTEFMYGSNLVIAAAEDKKDIVKYLVTKTGVAVNDREINLYENVDNGWEAIHWATAKGNNDMIKYLVNLGASVDSEAETDYRQTPLHFAIRFGKTETAKLLIELGADINKKDEYENSPLLYAFHYKNREIVKLLIEKGARPGVQGMNVNDLLMEYFRVGSFGEL